MDLFCRRVTEMSKRVYKLRPVNSWLIGEHESWMSDMAKKGLHLEKVGKIFVRFTKGEPSETKYRIDTIQGKKLTLDEKEMYSEFGWDYVTTYDDFNVFSSPAEKNAPELHTDPAEQSYTLSYLQRKLKKNTVILAACMILVAAAALFTTRLSDWRIYLTMVEGNYLNYISLVLETVCVFSALQAAISIGRLRKTLLEGRAINHSAPWRAKFRANLALLSILIGALFFQLTNIAIQVSKLKKETLPIENNTLPIVRLSEVEKNPSLKRYAWPYPKKNNIDNFNNYFYRWSFFSPEQYVTIERGIVEGEKWDDGPLFTIVEGSGYTLYTPMMHTRAYKLSFPSMQEKVLSDLMKRHSENYEAKVFTEREHPGFDKLLISEGKSSKEVFAAKGKGVIYIRYQGKADIDSIIEAVEEKIELISD
jgi:hypothetical protein